MAQRNYGRKVVLEIDGTPYELDVRKWEVGNEEGAVSFGAPFARQWFVELEGYQDHTTTSLWEFIWTHAGDTVDYTYMPFGNATAAPTQPHFTGTLTIGPEAGLGGSVNEVFVFETRWELDGKPTKVTS